jgi:uncharacterized membrane protein YfcA
MSLDFATDGKLHSVLPRAGQVDWLLAVSIGLPMIIGGYIPARM